RDEHNTEATCLQGLTEICSEEDSCLGLRYRKVKAVFDDWKLLVAAIDHTSVDGNRGRLKLRLLEIEQSPSRAITRILRLLHETADTIMEAPDASNPLDRYLDAASVETVLVGTLGAHQFQTFCRDFASVAKLDYGLRFFQAIMCGCIRASLGSKPIRPRGAWDRLNNDEIDALNALAKSETEISKLAERIALLFVKVLECLVSRYKEVLEPVPSQPRRFGFQLRDLTGDNKIREKIVDLLNQFPETEPAALTWIADEVTIWSMD
ncbi:MAG TPA: hypothetical protein VMC06_00590, partial [Opitutaceae bacterium]|nr:hypothetical protein [Opitutaceae bacterium]